VSDSKHDLLFSGFFISLSQFHFIETFCQLFLSARKADLKKGFQHLVVVVVVVVVVVGTRVKKRF
jgi:hypothetical protein